MGFLLKASWGGPIKGADKEFDQIFKVSRSGVGELPLSLLSRFLSKIGLDKPKTGQSKVAA